MGVTFTKSDNRQYKNIGSIYERKILQNNNFNSPFKRVSMMYKMKRTSQRPWSPTSQNVSEPYMYIEPLPNDPRLSRWRLGIRSNLQLGATSSVTARNVPSFSYLGAASNTYIVLVTNVSSLPEREDCFEANTEYSHQVCAKREGQSVCCPGALTTWLLFGISSYVIGYTSTSINS